MNQLRERLKREFADPEYREVYAESFLNSSLATQLQVIREQRDMTQAQLAEKIGTKQTGISRIENVNYSAWSIATLKKIAFALGCRLKVSLETFGSLIDEAAAFSEKALERPSFKDDPAFQSANSDDATAVDEDLEFQREEEERPAAAALLGHAETQPTAARLPNALPSFFLLPGDFQGSLRITQKPEALPTALQEKTRKIPVELDQERFHHPQQSAAGIGM